MSLIGPEKGLVEVVGLRDRRNKKREVVIDKWTLFFVFLVKLLYAIFRLKDKK